MIGLNVVLNFVYVKEMSLRIVLFGVIVSIVVMIVMLSILSCFISMSVFCDGGVCWKILYRFFISVEEYMISWLEIVFMIVVSIVVSMSLVMNGCSSVCDISSMIVFGLVRLMFVLVMQVMLMRFESIVLLREMIIYEMLMCWVFLVFCGECSVMKCMMMWG